MVTVDEIESLSSIHDIPTEIHVNKGVLLDPFLDDNLSDTPKTAVYDFDVYLKDYGINLQRPFVWTLLQQEEFIISLLLNKPIPPVVVVDLDTHESLNSEEPTKRLVIDGKQRLLTIKRFLMDDFCITVNGKNYRYSHFDKEAKGLFKRQITYLNATVYYATEDKECPWYMSDDMKITLFNFYNFAGTPQEKDHKDILQKLLNKNKL